MLMVWGWLIRRLTGGSQDPGFFGYLTSRDQNKTRIERDKVRMEETKEIISRLPYSAVYREGTADGWREIQMPPPPPVTTATRPASRRVRSTGITRPPL